MIIESLKYKFAMASCFPDSKGRASSLDLQNLAPGHKMSLINKVFRSKSDSSLKSGRKSPADSPTGSPRESPVSSPSAAPRRRFVRVVRDDQSAGEEYVNPHVVRKYNKGFIKTRYLKKSSSMDDADRPLPYTVTGNTILKKRHSVDADSTCSNKHTCFKEEVEIVEYDTQSKCALIMSDACIMRQKLQDETIGACSGNELQDDVASESSSPASDVLVRISSLDKPLEVIDEHKPLEDTVNLGEPSEVSAEKSENASTDICSRGAESSDLPADGQTVSEGSSAPKKSKIEDKSEPVPKKSDKDASQSLKRGGLEVEP